MRQDAISLPVTYPVFPRSLDCRVVSSKVSKGVATRSGSDVVSCSVCSGGGGESLCSGDGDGD